MHKPNQFLICQIATATTAEHLHDGLPSVGQETQGEGASKKSHSVSVAASRRDLDLGERKKRAWMKSVMLYDMLKHHERL